MRADEVAVEKAMAEEWLNAEGKTPFTSRKWHGAVAAKAVGMVRRDAVVMLYEWV